MHRLTIMVNFDGKTNDEAVKITNAIWHQIEDDVVNTLLECKIEQWTSEVAVSNLLKVRKEG